jgi:hypothetical protein
MPISVTCPRCQAAARVPETMLGQAVRCPHCLLPFRAPAEVPTAASEQTTAPPEEPPMVAAATGPIDDLVVPVVRVPRPTARVVTKQRADTNAGLRTGLAIGAAIFLVVGALGAGMVIMAMSREGGPTFHRGFMQPPPVPAERLPGDPEAGVGELVTTSRPRPKPLADVRMPDSRVHRAALAGPRRTLPGGFAVTPVQLDDAAETIGFCWSANADAFLTLSQSGRLRRIADPSLQEVRRLDIGQECSQLTTSGEGVLITLQRLQEIWVIDPESLAVRRRIGVAGLSEVVSGPDLAIALAFAYENVDGGTPVRIDLTTGVQSGVTLFQTTDGAGNAPAHVFRSPVLTEDGRFLFAGRGNPLRYRVEDDRLTFEAADLQPRRGSWRAKTIVSPDGRWLGAGGNVYSTADLNRPEFDLPETTTAAGFDQAGRRVFVSSPHQMLAIFDLAGRRGPVAAWPDQPAAARQLLVHPSGEGVLLRTDIGVLRVEAPAP